MENNFRSSYNRSFEYRNPVDCPLSEIHVRRKARKDLTTPVMQEKTSSMYNACFGFKNVDFKKNSDYFPRSSDNSRPNVKRLHEKYMDNPPKPQEIGLTTSGLAHKVLKPISTPETLQSVQPAKEYSFPMKPTGKDQFPFIPINEISSYKLLDIYVSTTHLAHTDFSQSQRNGIAKKDVITFYNTNNVPGSQNGGETHFEPNFHKSKTLYRLFPKQFSPVPHSGTASIYAKDYKHVTTNCNQLQGNFEFPAVNRLTKSDILTVPGMYCTEYSHLGTGLPVRVVVNSGKLESKF